MTKLRLPAASSAGSLSKPSEKARLKSRGSLAAKSGLTQKQYFIGTATGSWMQILASCLAGNFLIRGNIMFSVIAIFVQWAALAAVLWKREILMKKVENIH